MIIGIGKEIKKDESRVGLTPKKVKILIENNHTVLVEKDAGILSSFSNEDYINVGARIVEKPELYSKAELIIKVKNLFPEEVNLLSENQIIFTYLPLDEN
ncbi:MAG: alanine dehydrogenase, partial [Candidatus Aenigmarchaeota archaeon]|nr:alanine dehydrogenase [Candidatus Aenigmarchaeota archaeon]